MNSSNASAPSDELLTEVAAAVAQGQNVPFPGSKQRTIARNLLASGLQRDLHAGTDAELAELVRAAQVATEVGPRQRKIAGMLAAAGFSAPA